MKSNQAVKPNRTQQAYQPDATDLAFFEVDFGILRLAYSLGIAGAGYTQALGRRTKIVNHYDTNSGSYLWKKYSGCV